MYLLKAELFKAKLPSNDLCYLCLKTKQDLIHMLVSCPAVSEFWKIFLEWYETNRNKTRIVNRENLIWYHR